MKLQYISQQRQLIRSFYSGIGKTAVIFPSAFLVAVGSGLIGLGIIFEGGEEGDFGKRFRGFGELCLSQFLPQVAG